MLRQNKYGKHRQLWKRCWSVLGDEGEMALLPIDEHRWRKKHRLDRYQWSINCKKTSIRSMIFRRKKNLKLMVQFYRWKIFFFFDRWSILFVKNAKFLTDRSMLLVASMTDSISIDPSLIRRKQVYSSLKTCIEYKD
jgi:hypothetical protein